MTMNSNPYPREVHPSIVQYDEHVFVWLDETGNVGGAAPFLEEAKRQAAAYAKSLEHTSHTTRAGI
jgi:hypothetical protein